MKNRKSYSRCPALLAVLTVCSTVLFLFSSCGSGNGKPSSVGSDDPADTYRVWGDACREKGAKVILDSDGAGMVEGVKAKPFLIKPNSEELSHLMGRALDSQQELTAAARELLQTGVQKVIVSMG
uniref:PfkB family carbohydrate kinase n=1 Tax=Alistipes putredinis TaxID=28117 RepID=UPI00242F25EE